MALNISEEWESLRNEVLFKILFPTNLTSIPVCQPETSLSGVLSLETKKQIKASSIKLFLIGSEKVAIKPKSVFEIKKSTITQKRGGQLADLKAIRRVYFKPKIVLWERKSNNNDSEKNTEVIEPGNYSFHFSIDFPLVNYPENLKTSEFDIGYKIEAAIFPLTRNPQTYNSGKSFELKPISTTAAIKFIPRVAPKPLLIEKHRKKEGNTGYYFCDDVYERKSGECMYHMEVYSENSVFRQGENINLTVKLVGKKHIFNSVAEFVEQIDGYYPFSPNDAEGIESNSGWLWKKQRLLVQPTEAFFDGVDCEIEYCEKHRGLRKSDSNHTFISKLTIGPIPQNISLLNESFYMRFTNYISISGLVISSWNSTLNIEMQIPIPISNVANTKDKVYVLKGGEEKNIYKTRQTNLMSEAHNPSSYARGVVVKENMQFTQPSLMSAKKKTVSKKSAFDSRMSSNMNDMYMRISYSSIENVRDGNGTFLGAEKHTNSVPLMRNNKNSESFDISSGITFSKNFISFLMDNGKDMRKEEKTTEEVGKEEGKKEEREVVSKSEKKGGFKEFSKSIALRMGFRSNNNTKEEKSPRKGPEVKVNPAADMAIPLGLVKVSEYSQEDSMSVSSESRLSSKNTNGPTIQAMMLSFRNPQGKVTTKYYQY
ncbi:hypothetical protein BB558_004695 [Smittium angustum]|uniref:Arrestin-like N-terminal domain-containing protein n=1 Tax=Smittium angustum TaxID=133377 RepID=A0A2U1J2J9_SMIAN|nr:hypothetical protein BB558_004695 [Smittium angustum]